METLARGVVWIIQRFSLSNIRLLGRVLGLVFYHLATSRRRTAHSNLNLAYGDSLSPEEKQKIAKSSFINLATMALEFCWMPVCPYKTKEIIHIENPETILDAYKQEKGLIVLVPHMGNWEIESRWFSANGIVANIVSRSQKQPWVNRLVREIRAVNNVHEIDKRNALKAILSALRRKEAVVMLIDQHSRKEAVITEFFGKPAMTTASSALLAQRTGCVVMVGACFRCKDGRFGGAFSDPIPTQDTGDREKDLQENTQRYVMEIEKFVRKHPGDWMWMHRRWRVSGEKSSA
ncbi:MAG: lysophospholipid acyltransferase family protein [Candidatus Omnitrophica bacterium]|nr:lysophospholipid acyltransferase family protein [Candidatus Omnitrophota bacterium]